MELGILIFAIIFALVFTPRVCYLLYVWEFYFDLKRYNRENPDESIPMPGSFRELWRLYKRFCKLKWWGDFVTLYYHCYNGDSEEFDNGEP